MSSPQDHGAADPARLRGGAVDRQRALPHAAGRAGGAGGQPQAPGAGAVAAAEHDRVPLLRDDDASAQQQIAVLAHNHDVIVAALTDDGDRVITATRRAWVGRPIDEVLPELGLQQVGGDAAAPPSHRGRPARRIA